MIVSNRIANEIGEYSTIKLSCEIIEGLMDSRLHAKDIIKENFSNYAYILREFPDISKKTTNVYIAGNNRDRHIVFNINQYLDFLYCYFGERYEKERGVLENQKIFRRKLNDVESAKTIHDIHRISPYMFKNLIMRIKSEIEKVSGSRKYKDYLYAALKGYALGSTPCPEELESIIENVLEKYRQMECSSIAHFMDDIDSNYHNLDEVPNHYFSNISELDFKIVAAYSALANDQIRNRKDIKEFIGKFLSDNIYRVLTDYKITSVINKDGEKRNLELSLKNIVSLYERYYQEIINTSIEPKKEESDFPKFSESYIQEKLIKDKEVVQLPETIFQESDPNTFLEKVTRVKRDITHEKDDTGAEELFQKKVDLYSTLDVEKLYIGTDSFGGYFGFQMPNGIVILDTFFNKGKNGENTISTSDAIYVVDVGDFEIMNTMTRTEAMRAMRDGRIKGTRWYHAANWEDKVLNVATMDEDANLFTSMK